jgi:hypothetical protein
MFMGLVAAAIRHAYPAAGIEQLGKRWVPTAKAAAVG